MAKERIERDDLISQEAINAFAELSQKIVQAEQDLVDIAKAGGKLKENIASSKTFTELNESLIKLGDNMTKMLAVQNKLISSNKKLQVSSKTTAAQTQKNTQEINKQKAALDKLNSTTDTATKKKKGLMNAFNNLAKSATNYLLTLIAVRAVINFFTKTLLNLTTKLDALDFAMQAIIKDNIEYAQTKTMLAEIAINYGQNILMLTERYIKFRAATQQVNMSFRDTVKIFDSAAKAAAVLGLNTDEVNSVFLALEQMVSKGKVTTEELRRQLGERLPGAFGIMADAAGVSIREFDKMLKAGEILSSEILPKFADKLEEAYGIESVNKVNTLAAAQGRLKTSWVSFIDEIEASKPYINIINLFSEAINGLRNTMGLMSDYEYLLTNPGEYGERLRRAKEIFDEMGIERAMENQEKWIKLMKRDDEAISLKYIIRIYEEYIEKRKEMMAQTSQEIPLVFDVESEKKNLELIEKEFTTFTKITDAQFKKLYQEESPYIRSMSDSYKAFIKDQIAGMNKRIDAAKKILTEEEELRKRTTSEFNQISLSGHEADIKMAREAWQRQNKIAEAALNNYQGLIEWRGHLESEYWDIISKKEKKANNEALRIFKARQDAEIAAFIEAQHIMLMHKEQSLRDTGMDELTAERGTNQLKYDTEKNILEFKIEKAEEYLEHVRGNAQEEANAVRKLAELKRELAKETADFNIAQNKREHDEYMDRLRNEAIHTADEYERQLNARLLALQKEQTERNKLLKTPEEREALDFEYNVKSLEETISFLEKMVSVENLTANEIMSINNQIFNAKKQLQEAERAEYERTYGLRKQREREILDLTSKYISTGFKIFKDFQDAKMEQLEWDKEREMNSAGESLARRIAVENQYLEEKRKLQRRQAIVDRAQAAFNVILSTIEGVASALASVVTIPLIPYIKALGMIQLAAIFATPLPKYKEGGEHEGGPAVFSEAGEELFITKSGLVFLTPPKETIADMPPGEFIPHSETQRILANSVMNNFATEINSIDLNSTNSILRRIENKDNIQYSNGYKIKCKYNISGKYVTGS
jgi:tape measure domain-containing protein